MRKSFEGKWKKKLDIFLQLFQTLRLVFWSNETDQSYFSVDEFAVSYGAADRRFAEIEVKLGPTTIMSNSNL